MIRTNLARFLNAKSTESFPLEDKHVVNELHVVRKSHDATRKSCLHVIHFNVPRDWFERNSQHSLKAAKKIVGIAVYWEEYHFSCVVS